MNHRTMVAVTESPRVRWNCGTVEGISSWYKSYPRVSQYSNERFRFVSTLNFLLCHLARFESCWPALMKDSNGVVIVFNDDVPSHVKEVETWYSTFVASQGLRENQCLLLIHHKPGSGANTSPPPLGNMGH